MTTKYTHYRPTQEIRRTTITATVHTTAYHDNVTRDPANRRILDISSARSPLWRSHNSTFLAMEFICGIWFPEKLVTDGLWHPLVSYFWINEDLPTTPHLVLVFCLLNRISGTWQTAFCSGSMNTEARWLQTSNTFKTRRTCEFIFSIAHHALNWTIKPKGLFYTHWMTWVTHIRYNQHRH